MTVYSVARTAVGLTAAVRYEPEAAEGDVDVYAVWGDDYAGETRASWDGSVKIGTATAAAPDPSASAELQNRFSIIIKRWNN